MFRDTLKPNHDFSRRVNTGHIAMLTVVIRRSVTGTTHVQRPLYKSAKIYCVVGGLAYYVDCVFSTCGTLFEHFQAVLLQWPHKSPLVDYVVWFRSPVNQNTKHIPLQNESNGEDVRGAITNYHFPWLTCSVLKA